MPSKAKTYYICSRCGATQSKWSGQCRECGEWNTMEEEIAVPSPSTSVLGEARLNDDYCKAIPISEIDEAQDASERYQTEIGELDRALGGGIVKGSVLLISGEPGIGKSTLLLQICKRMQKLKILYVSGEESELQIRLRAKRLSAIADHVYLQCETNVDGILAEVARIQPDLLIIDSVQTLHDPSLSGTAGSTSQVKLCTSRLMTQTKKNGFSTILVGHVNKDGLIAGPKLLEHMVDVVLYFEGERTQSCRILRAVKNRYGSTNEIGLFEMTDTGLEEVPDPSKRLLEDSPKNVSGSCPVCLMEGTRPIITEVQVLITKSPFPAPKRLSSGIDFNRMAMLLAVLEKRLGLKLFDRDVYMNVVGGLRVDETASDLGICTAALSGALDLKLPGNLIAIGEIGLSGECRTVGDSDLRVGEAARLGFEFVLLPKKQAERLKKVPKGIKVIPVRSVYDLLDSLKEICHVQ